MNKKTFLLSSIPLVIILLMASCRKAEQKREHVTHADSILFAAGQALDYQRILMLTDSFEQNKDITRINANRWRGIAYNRMGQVKNAEFYYRKAVDAKIETVEDEYNYIKSARRLAELLVKRGEFEEALLVAMPALDRLKSQEGYSKKDYAILLNTIACCQLNLGRDREAGKNYDDVGRVMTELSRNDSDFRNLDEAIVVTDEMVQSYLMTHHYDKAYQWAQVADSFMQQRATQGPDTRPQLVAEYQGRVALHRLLALQGQGNTREAAALYREVAATDYAKSTEGLVGLASYLIEARRFSEAADNFTHLTKMVQELNVTPSLDNISTYLSPKFRANVGAGRTDSAVAIGMQLCNLLDSALVTAKQSDAAELATIYDTQQKESIIAEQRADMERQQRVGTIIAFLLVLLFLTIYTIHRIRAERRLAHAYQQLEEAHHKLEIAHHKLEQANLQLEEANLQLEQKNELLTVANERAEESSRMKTNFIQQISHEIRTPLNILSGYTQILASSGMELDDATRKDINTQIEENTVRITGLVNKMLELSDVNSQSVLERNDTVLAIQVAAQAAEDSGITSASHLTFDMQMGDGADSAMLQTNLQAATRALSLLLDNARKFTKPAEAYGQTATTGQQSVILHVNVTPDQHVQFIVEDTGIGVPPEEAEHIFNEFVQLNDYYDGTGIGLTVARSLARRLGGDIILDTSYAPGARFVMTL